MARPPQLAPTEVLAESKPHGVRLKYMAGCRCMRCRAANARYESEKQTRRKMGLGNGLVSAKRAQAHIIRLSKLGIGRRMVSDASGVGITTIQKVRSGIKTQIRANTERAILAVTSDAAADGAYIPARETWAKINWLLQEGFTKTQINQRALGNKSKGLKLRKDRILAVNALKIEKFYNLIRAE